MDNLIIRAKIRQNLKNVGTLPSIVSNLIKVLNNPRSSAKDIARVISMDPGLSARLLRLVNSAYYGFRTEVLDVQKAVGLVGFNVIRSFTFCVTVFDSLFNLQGLPGFNKEDFWTHCFGSGVVARSIASMLRMGNPEDYFIAGLLHDIGKVFILQFFNSSFLKIAQSTVRDDISFIQAERQVMGNLDHTLIGRWAMEEWGLPELLNRSVQFHHDPYQDEKFYTFVRIITLANNYCKEKRIGFGGDQILSHQYETLSREVGLTPMVKDRIHAQVQQEIAMYSRLIFSNRKSRITVNG